VDAAYAVFLRVGFKGFQQFAFELQTKAAKSLDPKRIEEYLAMINQEQGRDMCQVVMQYIIVVMAKYLQMMVAYWIHNEDLDQVTAEYDEFNRHVKELLASFKEVTGEELQPGKEIPMDRTVPAVRPSVQEAGSAADCTTINNSDKTASIQIEEVSERIRTVPCLASPQHICRFQTSLLLPLLPISQRWILMRLHFLSQPSVGPG
jgi:hypothetical protein